MGCKGANTAVKGWGKKKINQNHIYNHPSSQNKKLKIRTGNRFESV